MKEIGGYIELDRYHKPMLHEGAIALNCARNALAYLLEARNIKKLYIPIYLCEVVYEACKKINIEIEFYHINDRFIPELEAISDGYVLIVNYFGLLSNEDILNLKNKYKNIIVDNTHSFFQKNIENVDTIYNCRKYFGVPDGAYLESNLDIDNDIQVDNKSRFRFKHLLGRFETTASEYYNEFSCVDKSFDNEEVMYMSNITHNLLQGIDYKEVYSIRRRNFNELDKYLKKINKLNMVFKEQTFMYPLYVDNGNELRKKLIDNKIYVPKLWPNIPGNIELNELEKDYIENIVFLPIDQRYSVEDMIYILKIIGVL